MTNSFLLKNLQVWTSSAWPPGTMMTEPLSPNAFTKLGRDT